MFSHYLIHGHQEHYVENDEHYEDEPTDDPPDESCFRTLDQVGPEYIGRVTGVTGPEQPVLVPGGPLLEVLPKAAPVEQQEGQSMHRSLVQHLHGLVFVGHGLEGHPGQSDFTLAVLGVVLLHSQFAQSILHLVQSLQVAVRLSLLLPLPLVYALEVGLDVQYLAYVRELSFLSEFDAVGVHQVDLHLDEGGHLVEYL